MSENPYHVWIIRDGRPLEAGFGYAPEEWAVPGVDYYHPWQTFSSVADLKQYVELGPKVYYFNNISDFRDCDFTGMRFVHCD